MKYLQSLLSSVMASKIFLIVSTSLLLLGSVLNSSAQQWIDVEPSLGGVVDIIEVDENLFTISNLGILGISADNGTSWITKDIRDISTLDNPIFTSILFFDSSEGLICIRNQTSGNEVLKTSDGGETWEVLSVTYQETCPIEFAPISLTQVDDSTAIMTAHLSSFYYLTRDRGLNWTCFDPFSAPDWWQIKHTRTVTEWIFNSSQGLFKTDDQGENWTNILAKNIAYFQENENGELYALSWYYDEPDGRNILYHSSDDFQTYDSLILNQFPGEYIDLFIAMEDDQLYLRLNGKEIYHKVSGDKEFQSIQFLDNEPLTATQLKNSWYLHGRGLWLLDESLSTSQSTHLDPKVLVFPNPSKGLISIAGHEFDSYVLRSQTGLLIQASALEKQEIDISTLPKGIYYLGLLSSGGAQFHKIVKI